MRRFEMAEGTSSKFWEVSVDGADLTVCFGRIGTDGQSKTKTFADASKALAEQTKLIKEKTGKGYSEVGAAATANTIVPSATAPSATTAAKVASKTKLAPTVEANITTVAPTPPSPAPEIEPPSGIAEDAPALAKPDEEFVFTAARLALLPVLRGVKLGEYRADLSLLAGWADKVADAIKRGKAKAGAQRALAQWQPPELISFTQAFLAQSDPFWEADQAVLAMDRSQLLHADAAHWAEVLCQSFYASADNYQVETPNRGARICLALRGAVFTLDAVLRVSPLFFPVQVYGDHKSAMADLRSVIAALDDSEHAQALALAQSHFGQNTSKDGLIAFLLPHIEPFANAAALQVARNHAGALSNSCMDLATYRAFIADRRLQLWFYQDHHLTTLLFLVQRFGSAAALELIMDFFALGHDASIRKELAQFVVQLRTPKLIERLVEYAGDREVRPLLDRLTEQYPAEAIRAAMERAAQTRSKDLEQWAIRFASSQPQHVPAALAALAPSLRMKFAAQLSVLQCEAAPDEALPVVLRDPPWLRRTPAPSIPTLKLSATIAPPRYHWQIAPQIGASQGGHWTTEFERQWRKHGSANADDKTRALHTWVLGELKIKSEARARLLAGGDFQLDDLIVERWIWRALDHLLRLPNAVGLKLLQQIPSSAWSDYSPHDLLRLLATYGDEALLAVVRLVQAKPSELLSALAEVESVLCVPVMAHATKRLKRVRGEAFRWLKRYPYTAALALLPLSFEADCKDKALRDSAQYAMRWLQQNAGAEALAKAAQSYGPECVAALQTLLAIDPLQILPSKLPKLPPWFTPAAYARPQLKDDRPISPQAISHIGMMVALSSLEEPYGGIELVKESLNAASLAEFAWGVFASWMDAGAPSKESFGFLILALLGNDETARRLAPKIREWPGIAAHARAVTGLDYLAAIGSDVALMHLNAIADKAKFKGLQERARVKISELAEARGLSREELADRLVPDLGLDEDGALTLDFGPRQFIVGFDEALKPFVSDSQALRLKDLPKPNKADDASLANAAVERFKAIKKDAKTIASQQIARLELAMVNCRRWSAADFQLFFIAHPLMRFMSRRLLWGVYQNQQMLSAFRVAEDMTLADSADALYTLPNDCEVGIAHVLELPKTSALAFGEIFGDYNILQPFRQLSRETYALSDVESSAYSFTRFANKSVATMSVMGLMAKGWERDGAADGGWVGEFSRPLPNGLQAKLRIEPGTVIGDPNYEPYQKLVEVELRKVGTWEAQHRITLGQLSAVLISEIIRDLDLLPVASKDKA
jgi:predicted DNA-binding WGR domain protein